MKSDDEGEERVQVDPEEGRAKEEKKGTRENVRARRRKAQGQEEQSRKEAG